MLTYELTIGIILSVLVVWVTIDYKKYATVEKVKDALKNNYVLPIVVHKKQEYRVFGVKETGELVLEGVDTDKLVVVHFRKVKFVWK